jgi:hypothetical protein
MPREMLLFMEQLHFLMHLIFFGDRNRNFRACSAEAAAAGLDDMKRQIFPSWRTPRRFVCRDAKN